MKYADIMCNDFVDGENGISLSFWTQGCPHRCEGCHNPDTWDFDGGKEFTEDVFDDIIIGIGENNIKRNFSILGGEPLCDQNIDLVTEIVTRVRMVYPDITIYLWTGYTMEYLREDKSFKYDVVLDLVDVIIDGPFILSQRDITLPLRGSTNQRIWRHIDNEWIISK